MKCVILVNKKKILYLRRLLVIYNIFNYEKRFIYNKNIFLIKVNLQLNY